MTEVETAGEEDTQVRVSVDRDQLITALDDVIELAEHKSACPILGHVMITAHRGAHANIALVTTDVRSWATARISGECTVAGAVTLPAPRLRRIVGGMDPGNVELFPVPKRAVGVRGGRLTVYLSELSADDFPKPLCFSAAHTFGMAADDFHQMLNRVQHAISTEETRYYLNGVYLHVVEAHGEMRLTAVATDGKRLSMTSVPAPGACIGMPGVIIPTKLVKLMLRHSGSGEELVRIRISGKDANMPCISFECGSTSIQGKTIDGTFPDYPRVLPKAEDNEHELVADTAALLAAVDQVALVSWQRTRAVLVKAWGDEATVSCKDGDGDYAYVKLDCTFAGQENKICMQARYLLDVLRLLGPRVRMAFSAANKGSPISFEDPDDPEKRSLHVIMPMRL